MASREPGNIGPTRRAVSPANPSVNPDAFGAGVGRALGNLTQTYQRAALLGVETESANASMQAAYKQRQDKLLKAQLEVKLLDLTNTLTLGMSEDLKNAEPGAPGFTNLTERKVTEGYDKFLQEVPEDLKPDFLARVAASKNAIVTSAFSAQVTQENAEFIRNVEKFQGIYIDQLKSGIFTSPDEIDAAAADALENLDKLFANSPLSKTETRDLKEQAVVAIKTGKLARLAIDEAMGTFSNGGEVPGRLQTEGRVVKSSSVVASGLPAYAVGLLDAIAGPESSGEYNVMWSPDARRYFEDFSQHPNDAAPIYDGPHAGEKSSAAGRYMMIKGTWDDAQAALGLQDFSPENQDRGAWYIAQRDFRARTGRDLNAVLASGDPSAILEAKRILEPTWTGLKNLSDQAFLDKVTGATGTPSSLIYDEEFSSIPYDQRIAVVLDAQKQAATVQQAVAAEAQAIKSSQLTALENAIAANNAGMADINSFDAQYGLDYDQRTKLEKILQERDAVTWNSAQYVNKLQQPGYSTYTEEDKKQAADFYASVGLDQHLANRNQEFVQGTLVPITAQTHYIPPNVAQSLQSQMGSADPQQAIFALDTLNQLRGTDASSFNKAFSEDTQMAVALFNAAKESIPQEQLLAYIRNQADPAMKPIIDRRKELIKEEVKLNPEDFQATGIIAAMDYEGAVSPEVGDALAAEAWPLYNYLYAGLGDHGKTMGAVAGILKTRYGDFSFNGRTDFMKYPPNLTAPPFDNSYDYIPEQLMETFKILPEDNVQLLSDPTTAAEFQAGREASYTLWRYDENGFPVAPLKHKDLTSFDPHTDSDIAEEIVRWFPEVTPKMTQDLVDQNVRKNEITELRREIAAGIFAPESDFLPPEQNVGENPKIIKKSQLEAQQQFGRKDIYNSPNFLSDVISRLTSIEKDPAAAELISSMKKFEARSQEEAVQKIEEFISIANTAISPKSTRVAVINRLNSLLEGLGVPVDANARRESLKRARLEFLMQELEKDRAVPFKAPAFFNSVISGLRASSESSNSKKLIADIAAFTPQSRQEAQEFLQDILDNRLDTVYPVFQRWEVIRRVKNLLKELN